VSFKSKAQYERYKAMNPAHAEELRSAMPDFDKLPDRVTAAKPARPAAKGKPGASRASICGHRR
jgi:hypothetical protein